LWQSSIVNWYFWTSIEPEVSCENLNFGISRAVIDIFETISPTFLVVIFVVVVVVVVFYVHT
jgi:hypothetical protein